MTDSRRPAFEVHPVADGEATNLTVTFMGQPPRRYRIAGGEQDDYTTFHAQLAQDFGTSPPHGEGAAGAV